jgi:hypothetical protein
MAADAAAAVAAGFHSIELKVGRALEEDLEAVRAVAAAVGPNVPLRLDANGAWSSVAEASAAIGVFAAVARTAWIEQPLPRHDLDGLRPLRLRTGFRSWRMKAANLCATPTTWPATRRRTFSMFLRDRSRPPGSGGCDLCFCRGGGNSVHPG